MIIFIWLIWLLPIVLYIISEFLVCYQTLKSCQKPGEPIKIRDLFCEELFFDDTFVKILVVSCIPFVGWLILILLLIEYRKHYIQIPIFHQIYIVMRWIGKVISWIIYPIVFVLKGIKKCFGKLIKYIGNIEIG